QRRSRGVKISPLTRTSNFVPFGLDGLGAISARLHGLNPPKGGAKPKSPNIAAACRSNAGQDLSGPHPVSLTTGASDGARWSQPTVRSTHHARGTTNVRRLAPLPRRRMGDAPHHVLVDLRRCRNR